MSAVIRELAADVQPGLQGFSRPAIGGVPAEISEALDRRAAEESLRAKGSPRAEEEPRAKQLPRSKVRSFIQTRRSLIAAAVAVIVGVGGGSLILAPPSNEKTDDAYIGADVTTVAPRVRGFVSEVLVRDNQTVRAGQPLVRIDAEEFDSRVGTATAEVADAEAGVASARAALVSLDAEENLARANVGAAQTAIRSANAESAHATADAKRYASLVTTGAVAVRDAESLHTRAISAEQDVARSAALLKVTEESQHVTSAKRATLNASLQKAQATVERARAALDLAQQDQRHTLIVAPIEGVVGNRQVQQGDYLQPGSRLLTLVPLHDLYVTANFKETQTARMRPGQHVTVRVDAVPGHDFNGVVESLAPGSGSQFALLPFEPGTGNFTKIVQRVPVRIRFDAGQGGLEALRPGLSVTAKVKLGDSSVAGEKTVVASAVTSAPAGVLPENR